MIRESFLRESPDLSSVHGASRSRSFVHGRTGFTMIELIVVIGIIILAAGMMTPQITDFFKGRQLRQVTNTFRSTINSARLKAVNERTQVRLVFFREGIRVYDERERRFVDDLFNPDASIFAHKPGEGLKAWYVLGFYQDTPSVNLPSFVEWEGKVRPQPKKSAGSRRSRRAAAETSTADFSVAVQQLEGLPQIIFRRDGSVEFNVGSDVSSIYYKKEPPTGADLIIYVASNTSACYIDIQLTGQNRSKLVALEAEPQPPIDPADSTSNPDEGRRRTRSRARR